MQFQPLDTARVHLHTIAVRIATTAALHQLVCSAVLLFWCSQFPIPSQQLQTAVPAGSPIEQLYAIATSSSIDHLRGSPRAARNREACC